MRKEKTLGLEKKKIIAVGISLTIFSFSILVLILSLRNLRVFLLYGFPEEKHCVHCLLCLIDVHVILLIKDPNNASLNVEKLTLLDCQLLVSVLSPHEVEGGG